MRAILVAVCLILAFAVPSQGAGLAAVALSPEAREQRLLTKVGPQTRLWIKTEARRGLTPGAELSEAALARSVRTLGPMPQQDVDSIIFLVMMEMTRMAQAETRTDRTLPAPPASQVLRQQAPGTQPAISIPQQSAPQVTPLIPKAFGDDQKAPSPRDPAGDQAEMEQLRLQEAMRKYSQSQALLSNILKKIAETSGTLIQNLK